MSDTANPSPLAPTVSPLTEADPNSLNDLIAQRIDEIFNKKPPYSDDDLRVQVEYYRKNRQRFLLESQAKEALPRGQRRKAVPKSVADALAGDQDIL